MRRTRHPALAAARSILLLVGLALPTLSAAGAVVSLPVERAGAAPPAPPPVAHLVAIVPSSVAAAAANGSWSNATGSSGTPPSPRTAYAMAYAPGMNALVLFGGRDPSGGALGDTWEYRSGLWSNVTSSFRSAPPARWGAGFVYDASVGGFVLFGGATPGGPLNDTWTLTSAGWTRWSHGPAPSPRVASGMVYDSSDGTALLVANASAGTEDDVWTFAHGSWSNATATVQGTVPPRGVAAADDPAGREVVFWEGGGPASGSNGTWAYRNGTFTNLSANQSAVPAVATDAPLPAFDPNEGGVVALGGSGPNGTPGNETWRWAGGLWSNLSGASGSSPPARASATLVYDSALGADVVFGGNRSVGTASNDTWMFITGDAISASADPTEHAAPASVTFNASVGRGTAPFAFRWSFGDGNSSSAGPNVTHVYSRPGTYWATVTVTDATNGSGQFELSVAVLTALKVSASASPATGDAPLSVNFSAAAVGGAGGYDFAWGFGDGAWANGSASTHQYASGGLYRWSVNVTDAVGDFESASGNVSVSGGISVVASARPLVGPAPLTVEFAANASNGSAPYAFNWSFGDGSPNGSGDRTTHDYGQTGNYSAELVVADSGGGRFVESFGVEVVAPLSLNVSAGPTDGYAPVTVQFGASVSGGLAPFSVTWVFGAGLANATGSATSATFSRVGTYPVTAVARDASGQSSEANVTIEVGAVPKLTLTSSAARGLSPFNVSFFAGVSGGIPPLSYRWSFGNSTVVSGPANVSHEFNATGAFLVSVTAVDALATQVSRSMNVEVAGPLQVSIAVGSPRLSVGAGTTIQASASGGFPGYSYEWEGLPFGCAPLNASSIPCHPSAPGTFHVNVSVVDLFGDRATSDNATVTVTASVGVPAPASPAGGHTLLVEAGLAALAAVALATAGWALAQRSTPRPSASAPPRPRPPPSAPMRSDELAAEPDLDLLFT